MMWSIEMYVVFGVLFRPFVEEQTLSYISDTMDKFQEEKFERLRSS